MNVYCTTFSKTMFSPLYLFPTSFTIRLFLLIPVIFSFFGNWDDFHSFFRPFGCTLSLANSSPSPFCLSCTPSLAHSLSSLAADSCPCYLCSRLGTFLVVHPFPFTCVTCCTSCFLSELGPVFSCPLTGRQRLFLGFKGCCREG